LFFPYTGGFRGSRGFREGRGRGIRGERRQTFDPSTPLSNVRVYITNLPFSLTQSELESAFTEKGYQVKKVSLDICRFNSSRNVGYGYIEFINADEQARVLKEIPLFNIKGRNCTISPARAVLEKSSVPATVSGDSDSK
jgi:RNA recognition motif-containing protein